VIAYAFGWTARADQAIFAAVDKGDMNRAAALMLRHYGNALLGHARLLPDLPQRRLHVGCLRGPHLPACVEQRVDQRRDFFARPGRG
jgi:hypothetical protein